MMNKSVILTIMLSFVINLVVMGNQQTKEGKLPERPTREPTLEEHKLLDSLETEMGKLRNYFEWRPGRSYFKPSFSDSDKEQLKKVLSRLVKMGGDLEIYNVFKSVNEIGVLTVGCVSYAKKFKSKKGGGRSSLATAQYALDAVDAQLKVLEAAFLLGSIKTELYSNFERALSHDQSGTYGDNNSTHVSPWLAKKDSPLRAEAARVLGILKSKTSVAILIEASNDPEHSIRDEASKSLGAIGDTSATTALITRLKDDSTVVRFSAAVALYSISGEDNNVIIEPVKEQMLDSLKDENKDMRIKAIESLASLRAVEALDDLKQIAKEDPDEKVRDVANKRIEELENVIKPSVQKY